MKNLFEQPPEHSVELIDLIDKFFHFNFCCMFTARTDENRVVFEPSELLIEFSAAVAARDFDQLRIIIKRHQTFPATSTETLPVPAPENQP